jgi:hypothetical protein
MRPNPALASPFLPLISRLAVVEIYDLLPDALGFLPLRKSFSFAGLSVLPVLFQKLHKRTLRHEYRPSQLEEIQPSLSAVLTQSVLRDSI